MSETNEPQPGRKYINLIPGGIRTPPVPEQCRLQFGYLIRRIQQRLPVPPKTIKAMKTVGAQCYELRLSAEGGEWRVILKIGDNAVMPLDVFFKNSSKTPRGVIETCRKRLAESGE